MDVSSPDSPATATPAMSHREVEVLLEKMAQEHAVCQSLLTLNADERAALIGGRLNDLAQVAEEKERLVNKIGRLEGECSRLVEDWANRQGIAPDAPTKMQLAMAGESESRELAEMTCNLTALVKQVADGNRANAELLQHSLQVTRELLHCITSLDCVDGGYSVAGQPQPFTAIGRPSLNCQA
jgi:flagellar biosynthesis/type III secretory pathway chaperone